MSVEKIMNEWSQDPTVKPSQQVTTKPNNQKTMVELIEERVGVLSPAQDHQSQQQDLSKAEEIEQLWKTDLGRSETEKYIESLSPEDFKKEFQNRMSTMDIGERTELERFLFGSTAQKSNPVQSFLRGIRKELGETGLGVKQRFEDLTGTATPESERKNELMRRQLQQQVKTRYPVTTTTGEITGTVAELAPLAFTGAGAPALLAEGAVYGATRPQEKGYTALDVAKKTGGEALLSLVGGKATQKLVDAASPILRSVYGRITGKKPSGNLINEFGEPSQELVDALEKQGISYDQLMSETDVFKQIKQALKAQPTGADPEQAVRAARYESLGISPVKSSVTQGFDGAVESQVLRRQINDPEAAQLREALAEESEGFKKALINLAEETGDPDVIEAGETIRRAIQGRAKEQRKSKSAVYKALAEEAEAVGDTLPVESSSVLDAWNQTKKIKRSQMSPLHSDVKESLMRYGVIEPDDAFLKMIDKGEEEITQLSAKNFETLRQELNANINPQDPATSAIIKPIINALDGAVDIAAEGAEKSAKLSILSKEARAKAKEFKQEFDSKTMVADILKPKKGTFDTYKIRGQDIFNKLIKTSRKTPTAQQLSEVITTLEKSGRKGKKAIADLQSATIMVLLKEATSQLSAKGMKGQQFSYTAFRKALEGIGDKELNILFKNNKQGLSKLKELGKAAQDSQTFFDAIPKGSAADIQNMFTRSFAPLFETIGFAKAGFIGRLAAQSLTEKANERLSKGKLRKAVAQEIKAKPEIRQELVKLSKQYPGVFEAIGIAVSDKAIREDE